jgi:Tol biopolymer transport system component
LTTPKDCVLYTVKAGKHWALARMDVGGQCKRFLSQAQGRHWIGTLPLENKFDDLAGIGSADGKWIAFLSNRNGALNLWLTKSDGSGAEALTSEETDITSVDNNAEKLAFSPDSKFLAFVMHEDLWLMNLADRSLVSLSKGQGVGALAWSSNSRWIAYVQGRSLFRIAVSGAPNELLSSNNINYPTIAWAGDADKGNDGQ